MIDSRLEPLAAMAAVVPDAVQARAIAYRGPLLRVLGGPGTGKTTLAIEIVADRVARGDVSPAQLLVLAATRRAAAGLRTAVTARLGATTREPLARTFASFGFGVLRRAAVLHDAPTPRLLSGAEQDVILRELLAGHRADPGSGPAWPEHVVEALPTRGFRAELRDLLMRAVEHGVEAVDLADLGRTHGRPEWVAAASVLNEYDQVTALSRPGAYDPAWILTAASDTLEWEPDLLDALADEIRLIVVDDAQEITAPGARLLRVLAGAGIPVVVIGDPDLAVQTFRGADPTFLASDWSQLGPGESLVLSTGHRLPTEIAEQAGRVAGLIGAHGGARQRGARPATAGGAFGVHLFRSTAQEAAFVADVLRRAHLLDGMAWEDMAVVVRGQARAETVRRTLTAAQVPAAQVGAGLSLREEPAVRPLLEVYAAALGASSPGSAAGVLSAESAVDLLTSPFGEADAVTLRRLRRGLRRQALDGGCSDSADNLVAGALANPGRLLDLGPEARGARRIARMLTAGTTAAGVLGASAEDVLWAIWAAAGVAATWRAQALAGGRAGRRADRHLDAVVALFAAAATLVDRLPGVGPRAFLDHIRSQDVAADSIVPRSPDGAAVAVVTPHAAAGRAWKLVAVVGVQEGSWPDLRLRGSLLGSERLVDVLAGREGSPRAAVTAVRHDEARLFYVALTRASERVLVSAVRSEDEQASPYLDLIGRASPVDDVGAALMRPFTEVDHPLTLVGVVGGHRRSLVARCGPQPHAASAVPTDPTGASATRSASAVMGARPDEGVDDTDAAVLAALADAGVRGADPSSWWALRDVSDHRPRRDPEAPVRVSPSALATFGDCPLRWLLQRSGGEGPSVGSAAVGTLVHEVIAECGDADAATLDAALMQRWARLGLPQGWIDRGKRSEASDMVARAAAYFALAEQEGWHRAGAEVPMRVQVGRAEVAGTIDRLERRDDGTLRVVDYKTGTTKPTKAELDTVPQLGAYQLAVVGGSFGEIGSRSGGAVLVQLGRAGSGALCKVKQRVQEQTPLADAPDPHWATRLVTETAEAMGASVYLARVGSGCRTCQVRTSCPAVPDGVTLA